MNLFIGILLSILGQVLVVLLLASLIEPVEIVSNSNSFLTFCEINVLTDPVSIKDILIFGKNI
jgi:hypothetical protein